MAAILLKLIVGFVSGVSMILVGFFAVVWELYTGWLRKLTGQS